MATAHMHWAGRRLSPDEEDELRGTVALLERTGHAELAAHFARFLPEHDARLDARRAGAGRGRRAVGALRADVS